MEHHVLSRPTIASRRRRPSKVMTLSISKVSPLGENLSRDVKPKRLGRGIQKVSSSNELEEKVESPKPTAVAGAPKALGGNIFKDLAAEAVLKNSSRVLRERHVDFLRTGDSKPVESEVDGTLGDFASKKRFFESVSKSPMTKTQNVLSKKASSEEETPATAQAVKLVGMVGIPEESNGAASEVPVDTISPESRAKIGKVPAVEPSTNGLGIVLNDQALKVASEGRIVKPVVSPPKRMSERKSYAIIPRQGNNSPIRAVEALRFPDTAIHAFSLNDLQTIAFEKSRRGILFWLVVIWTLWCTGVLLLIL